MSLAELLQETARLRPKSQAVRSPDGALTYGELLGWADRIAAGLIELGVRPGDRVGIWLEKSIWAVAAMQGVLRAGAAYVPLDPLSPPARVRQIVSDCELRVLVARSAAARQVLDGDGYKPLPDTRCLCPDRRWRGLSFADLTQAHPARGGSNPQPDDLAYILYTSGSTGRPKGVCISHQNALAFVRWAAAEVGARPDDRFSNHAPFHFDLSVFDLYVAFHAGGVVSLVPEGTAYAPNRLVRFLIDEEITVWYSVPSALQLMMVHGGLLRERDLLPLRTIVFAGEPFPIGQLRRLARHFEHCRLFNFYGPTETNVCTSYEVRGVPPDDARSIPIGQAASGDTVWAVDDDGREIEPGETGELMVTGPTVMLGYYGEAFHGDAPYATGDLVRLRPDGNYDYLGRRDEMIKMRGFRVELGDVEAALQEHDAVEEAAVCVVGEGLEARLVAFIVAREVGVSLLAIKQHLAQRVPRHMIVDRVRRLQELPRTRNGKVDRRRLVSELPNRDYEEIYATG